VAFSLATTRTHQRFRAVVDAADRDGLRAGLAAVAESRSEPGVVTGEADGGGLAVLFPGQGTQRPGMGRELRAAFPVFAERYDEAAAALRLPELDDPEQLNQTRWTQPAVFAVEVALFRLLEHWGLRPDHLLGHSVGQIAAAHVAGVLSLQDAASLVTGRAELMQSLPAGGAMVALVASEEEVLPHLQRWPGRVGLAAVNGPRAVVISGEEAAVLEIAGAFPRARRLHVSHAFHSPLMDPILPSFAAVAGSLTYRAPRIPIVSTASGRPAGADELRSPDHWVQHLRGTVRFGDGLQWLADRGVTTLLEVGPGATLTALARAAAEQAVAVPTLRHNRPETGSVGAAADQSTR
jgi:acyl transferase domain-containing protein